MSIDFAQQKQHAHELVEQLAPDKLSAVVGLLEVIIHDEDEITEEDRRAIVASREYFRNGGQGVPFEQVVAECGFTMEQIRSHKSE